jgi:hypothetical protein
MMNGRLQTIVTVALALGLAYLGFERYRSADRLPATNEASQRSKEPAAEAWVPPGARDGKGDRAQSGSPDISVAVLRQALSAMGSGQERAEPMAEAPVAQARRTLDERLLGGQSNPNQVARLERTIRPLLVPAVLGETVAEVRCSATMCRVNLIGEDDARVDSAANTFAEQLPKSFASAVTYPDGAGHRSVYLGTNADDLKLTTQPYQTLEVVDRQPTKPL